MATRGNKVERVMGRPQVRLTIDHVEHTLSEAAFIELMERAIDVMQSLVWSRARGAPKKGLAPNG